MSEVSKNVKVSVFCKNATGYGLTLIAILFELMFSIRILDSTPVGVMMGVSCGINIILLFVLFSVGVKVNVYQVGWAYVGLACAGYALLRAFVLLPVFLKPTSNQRVLFVVTLLEGMVELVASLVSLVGSKRRARFLATPEGKELVGQEV